MNDHDAVVVMHDVTDLKRTEKELQASKHLLASLLTNSLDGIMAFKALRDAAGRIVDFEWVLANPRSEALTGFKADALLGKRLLEEMPGNRDAGLFDAYVRVVETGEPYEDQLYYSHEGMASWFRIAAVKLFDGFAVTFRDISESKQAEQALREREARFRLLAENMNDLVSLHDAEGRFLYASPSVERILGYPPALLVGKCLFDLVHEDDVERVLEEMEAHRSEGSAFWLTVMRVRTVQEAYLWLEATLTFVRDEAGDVVQLQSSARDVTERIRAERELDRSHEALRQRNRELHDFTHVASHDLQEPLRKIRAFADLMVEDYASVVDEDGLYYLQRMQEAAARMARLISDLLAFSRVSTKAQPFEQVDLNRIAADVVSDLEMLIGDVNGHVEVGPLPVLEVDPTQMRQLLQNLIGNALKFHEAGVEPVVRVTAALKEGDGKDLNELVCVLQVSDNGIGFDEKYLDRIFTPFKRLHGRNTFAGTGMGLAICRRIVERHRGTITAHSAPGEGATFVVVLPVRQEQEDAREDAR